MGELRLGLEMMLYGIGTTFTILILFYFVIKILTKIFPEK
ncbi:hypothetical protein DW1_2465 [Proteiniborus sp. DW1]|nr:OadG family protein [Proteiniborus sp. DW1]SCG84029.1 hypothetical protein DW1_2465 [Proteiniborus sp. DW1]